MSSRLALSLALLVFLVTVLARLPARVVTALLPATIVCDQPEGTVWHGGCGRVQSGAFALDDLAWTVHPLGLLGLRLSADVSSSDPRLNGRAHLELERGGTVAVQALEAQLPLQGGLSVFPPGFQGTIELDVASLRLDHGALSELVGAARALQLRNDSLGELGNFELRFAPAGPDGPIVGELRDLSGPLSLQGQVALTRQFGYQVSGSLLARAAASSELTQTLQLLGAPDSEGRRSFTLAGSL
jgi:hypothetical protein